MALKIKQLFFFNTQSLNTDFQHSSHGPVGSVQNEPGNCLGK